MSVGLGCDRLWLVFVCCWFWLKVWCDYVVGLVLWLYGLNLVLNGLVFCVVFGWYFMVVCVGCFCLLGVWLVIGLVSFSWCWCVLVCCSGLWIWLIGWIGCFFFCWSWCCLGWCGIWLGFWCRLVFGLIVDGCCSGSCWLGGCWFLLFVVFWWYVGLLLLIWGCWLLVVLFLIWFVIVWLFVWCWW